MNFATFERAQVAAFAYREAIHTGSLDAMRAICFVLRNRVRAGWGDGSWLSVINAHGEVSARTLLVDALHLPPSDRLLQLIVRDVDDIYLGQDRSDDNVRNIVCTEEKNKPVLYWSFVGQTPGDWFIENIVRKPADHAHVGNIGPLILYR